MTRVEGYSEIVTYQDKEKGLSIDFSMPKFSDFENFLVGRRIEEAPMIVPRICGICPVSHEIASCKAMENILHIEPPMTAKMLRLLMLLAEFMKSHIINYLFMTAPDLSSLATSSKRTDIIGILEHNPMLYRKAVDLIQTSDEILNMLGGRAIHPVYSVIGGISKPLIREDRDELLGIMKSAVKSTGWIFNMCNKLLKDIEDRHIFDLISPSYHLTSFEKDEGLLFYGGNIKVISDTGNIVKEFKPKDFFNYVKSIKWIDGQSKFLYLPKKGEEHTLMTGPQARAIFRKEKTGIERKTELKNMLYLNLLRLEEITYCAYRCLDLLENPQIINTEIRTDFSYSEGISCGVIEAPRGILIHQYKINSQGLIDSARIITPTNIKAYGMNMAISEFIETTSELDLPENELVEKVKIAIRSFDPCVSCATHTKN